MLSHKVFVFKYIEQPGIIIYSTNLQTLYHDVILDANQKLISLGVVQFFQNREEIKDDIIIAFNNKIKIQFIGCFDAHIECFSIHNILDCLPKSLDLG